MAGRIELVNSVIGGSINYWIQCYKLPTSVVRNFTRTIRKFIWNFSKPSWKWDALCLPKRNGGLGVQSVEFAQQIFGLKLFWRLCNNSTLWSAWMRNVYLKNQPIASISSTLLDSGTWKWIASSKDVALQHLEIDLSVETNDQIWRWDGASFCTAAVIRSSLRANQPVYPLYKLIWSPIGAPKMSVCTIRALHNRLPTADRIYDTQVNCYLCNTEPETIQHIYFKCPYSYHIWSSIRHILAFNLLRA